MNYMSTEEAAQEAGVSSATVRRWIKDGVLNAQKIAGLWLVDATDLDELITTDVVAPEVMLCDAERMKSDPPIAAHPNDRIRTQIETSFTYHAPKGDQGARYVQLRDAAKAYALLIAELTPPSREQSLAITKLEESVMFANAAIARNE